MKLYCYSMTVIRKHIAIAGLLSGRAQRGVTCLTITYALTEYSTSPRLVSTRHVSDTLAVRTCRQKNSNEHAVDVLRSVRAYNTCYYGDWFRPTILVLFFARELKTMYT